MPFHSTQIYSEVRIHVMGAAAAGTNKGLIWLLILSLVASSNGAIEVIILAGQSNMSGRGGVSQGLWDGKVPAEAVAPKGSVLRLNKFLQWEEAREPLHRGIDSGTTGVGPGQVFAATLVHKGWTESGTTIGLVPCARGGSYLSEWQKGEPLYESMLQRTNAALAAGGRIKALLWYQGESDARSSLDASLFQTRLERLIADLRADLAVDMMPVVQVGITLPSCVSLRSYQTVRQAQKLVSRTVPAVYYVDADGLELKRDGIHLSTQGQTHLGIMLANSYVEHYFLRKPH